MKFKSRVTGRIIAVADSALAAQMIRSGRYKVVMDAFDESKHKRAPNGQFGSGGGSSSGGSSSGGSSSGGSFDAKSKASSIGKELKSHMEQNGSDRRWLDNEIGDIESGTYDKENGIEGISDKERSDLVSELKSMFK